MGVALSKQVKQERESRFSEQRSSYSSSFVKIALLAFMGLYFLIVGTDNIIDYDTNLQFVKHVLSMDSIPQDSKLLWRRIESPLAQNCAYWLIIVWELAIGGICLAAVPKLWKARRGTKVFLMDKRLAIIGLGLGLLLWLGAFVVVGGEWFQMWRSTWNGETTAFRMFMINGFILLLFVLPEK